MMSQSDETSPHRLFAAIVLMGTGLVVGCGGMAEGERPGGGNGSAGNGQSGSGAAAGPNGSGASVSSGTGGSTTSSTGGSAPDIMLETGGVAAGPVTPGPFSCPPQQWTCAERQCDYSHNGWPLQDDCDCDPGRPLQASDCKAGEVFVCLNATSTADGRPLTEAVLMSCTCVPKTVYGCSDACGKAFDRRDLSCRVSEDELGVACGCAIPYLK